MATAECFFCFEAFTPMRFSKHERISCPACEYTVCSTCVKQVIKDAKQPVPRCSNCRTEWTPAFIVKTFGRKYYDDAICGTTVREAYFDIEMAMMPPTQAHMQCQKEADEFEDEARRLQRAAAELSQRATNLRLGQSSEATQRRKETTGRPCSREGCNGYFVHDTVNGVMHCPQCRNAICSHCREDVDIARTVDAAEWAEGANKYGHACDPDILANVRSILDSNDTRMCPRCSQPIHRTEGCAQMLCIECGTAFDWRTGAIDQGPIHNPHLRQYGERMGRSLDQLQRRPCEAAAAGAVGFYDVDRAVRGLPQRTLLLAAQRVCTHMERVTLRTLRESVDKYRPNRFETNLDLRIRLLNHDIEDVRFKDLVKDRYRRFERSQQKFQIIEAFVEMASDVLRGMVRRAKTPVQAVEELGVVQRIHVEAVREFVRMFACSCPFANESFEEKMMYAGGHLEPPSKRRRTAAVA